jgi:hypothetical protein
MEVNDQLYSPANLPAKERALIHTEQEVGGGSRAGLDFSEKREIFAIVGGEIQNLPALGSLWVQMGVTDSVTHSEGY